METSALLDLAKQLVDNAQMVAPIRPHRIATHYGCDVLTVSGPVLVSVIGRRIIANATQSLRDREGDIARAFARLQLLRHGYPVDAAHMEFLARQVTLPLTQFARDLAAVDGDLDVLAHEHPFAPVTWIADSADEVRAQERDAALRVVHLSDIHRARSQVAPRGR
jgi:hypothetical protein